MPAPTFTTGPLGGSAVRIVASSGGYLTSAASSAFPSGASARTITFWMRIEDAGPASGYPYGNGGTILGWRYDWTTYSSTVWYSDSSSGGSLSFSSYNNDWYASQAGRFIPGFWSWQHYAIRYDGSRGVDIFVNGTLFASGQLPSAANTMSGRALTVGWRGWCCGNAPFRFTGVLSDLGIFSRALSSTEVSQIAVGSVQLTAAQLSSSLTASATPGAAPTPSPTSTLSAGATTLIQQSTSLCQSRFAATAYYFCLINDGATTCWGRLSDGTGACGSNAAGCYVGPKQHPHGQRRLLCCVRHEDGP